ncbi:ABC transporter permease [Gryllotalpicola reticulitermitis]|uniref:ABC transporter permease n=1 Tax=Gryllotalpicola reticulitermitis TaxID=1184153 RepID=A0ABV8Q4F3_9MICO
MTTATAPAQSPSPTSTNVHLSALGLLRSEWIKLRTVRSTIWCYALIILLTIGIGVLVSSLATLPTATTTGDAARSLTVTAATGGINLAVLIVSILGTLIITGEYATGMIRSTFTADPRRLGAIVAKMVILAVTAFITSGIAIWLNALIVWPILHHRGVDVQLGDPSVFMPLLGGSVFVTLISLLAFGFGLILRSTAGGLATVLGLLLVAPIILGILTGLTHADWVGDLRAIFPDSAGGQLVSYATPGSKTGIVNGILTLNGWLGFWVMLGWDAVVLTVASVLVKRRDA